MPRKLDSTDYPSGRDVQIFLKWMLETYRGLCSSTLDVNQPFSVQARYSVSAIRKKVFHLPSADGVVDDDFYARVPEEIRSQMEEARRQEVPWHPVQTSTRPTEEETPPPRPPTGRRPPH